MSKIFGGSKQKSTSQSTSTQSSFNRAFEPVSQAFSPLMGLANQGATALNQFLGGNTSGFDAFRDATGYDFAESQGIRALTAGSSGLGSLLSGNTGRALTSFGNNLQSQYANSYMDRLLQQAGLGFNAGQLISGAGGTSQSSSQSTGSSTGSSTGGLAGLLGSIAGGVARG